MPLDPELIAEAERRGTIDPELIAEAKRRLPTAIQPSMPPPSDVRGSIRYRNEHPEVVPSRYGDPNARSSFLESMVNRALGGNGEPNGPAMGPIDSIAAQARGIKQAFVPPGSTDYNPEEGKYGFVPNMLKSVGKEFIITPDSGRGQAIKRLTDPAYKYDSVANQLPDIYEAAVPVAGGIVAGLTRGGMSPNPETRAENLGNMESFLVPSASKLVREKAAMIAPAAERGAGKLLSSAAHLPDKIGRKFARTNEAGQLAGPAREVLERGAASGADHVKYRSFTKGGLRERVRTAVGKTDDIIATKEDAINPGDVQFDPREIARNLDTRMESMAKLDGNGEVMRASNGMPIGRTSPARNAIRKMWEQRQDALTNGSEGPGSNIDFHDIVGDKRMLGRNVYSAEKAQMGELTESSPLFGGKVAHDIYQQKIGEMLPELQKDYTANHAYRTMERGLDKAISSDYIAGIIPKSIIKYGLARALVHGVGWSTGYFGVTAATDALISGLTSTYGKTLGASALWRIAKFLENGDLQGAASIANPAFAQKKTTTGTSNTDGLDAPGGEPGGARGGGVGNTSSVPPPPAGRGPTSSTSTAGGMPPPVAAGPAGGPVAEPTLPTSRPTGTARQFVVPEDIEGRPVPGDSLPLSRIRADVDVQRKLTAAIAAAAKNGQHDVARQLQAEYQSRFGQRQNLSNQLSGRAVAVAGAMPADINPVRPTGDLRADLDITRAADSIPDASNPTGPRPQEMISPDAAKKAAIGPRLARTKLTFEDSDKPFKPTAADRMAKIRDKIMVGRTGENAYVKTARRPNRTVRFATADQPTTEPAAAKPTPTPAPTPTADPNAPNTRLSSTPQQIADEAVVAKREEYRKQNAQLGIKSDALDEKPAANAHATAPTPTSARKPTLPTSRPKPPAPTPTPTLTPEQVDAGHAPAGHVSARDVMQKFDEQKGDFKSVKRSSEAVDPEKQKPLSTAGQPTNAKFKAGQVLAYEGNPLRVVTVGRTHSTVEIAAKANGKTVRRHTTVPNETINEFMTRTKQTGTGAGAGSPAASAPPLAESAGSKVKAAVRDVKSAPTVRHTVDKPDGTKLHFVNKAGAKTVMTDDEMAQINKQAAAKPKSSTSAPTSASASSFHVGDRVEFTTGKGTVVRGRISEIDHMSQEHVVEADDRKLYPVTAQLHTMKRIK